MSIWFLCYSFSSTVFRRSELKQLGSLTSSKMKKKKQAAIEPLFHFFLSGAVTFSQISKLTILLKRKNEILSAVSILEP